MWLKKMGSLMNTLRTLLVFCMFVCGVQTLTNCTEAPPQQVRTGQAYKPDENDQGLAGKGGLDSENGGKPNKTEDSINTVTGGLNSGTSGGVPAGNTEEAKIEEPAIAGGGGETPQQCQPDAWGACRRTEGVITCDQVHYCSEKDVVEVSVAQQVKSEKCSKLSEYEACRSQNSSNDVKKAVCDKTFQCTIADITLKSSGGPVAGGGILNPTSGGTANLQCREKERADCHKGAGGFSCDVKNSCASPVPATSTECHALGFGLCKEAKNTAGVTLNKIEDCTKIYRCSSTTSTGEPKTNVEEKKNNPNVTDETCDKSKRDICLAGLGGFACYEKHKCKTPFAAETNQCDAYGLKLCLEKKIGQTCYQTYKCSTSKTVEAKPEVNKIPQKNTNVGQNAKPVVRLDTKCFQGLYAQCKTGQGGDACNDQSSQRYATCRR
jgi:hypothetical protein